MIAAVVLAAGASSRFGTQKLVARVGGISLIRIVVEQVRAGPVDRLWVVLGRDAPAVREALSGLPVTFVPNPDYSQGMSTSLRRGILALDARVEAVVVVLGDQPLPSPEIVPGLVRAHRAGGRSIIAPSYNGQRGNPVLFARALFPELAEVAGDQGARGLIARHPERVQLVEHHFPPPVDIDTQQDYEELLKRYPSAEWGANPKPQ